MRTVLLVVKATRGNELSRFQKKALPARVFARGRNFLCAEHVR